MYLNDCNSIKYTIFIINEQLFYNAQRVTTILFILKIQVNYSDFFYIHFLLLSNIKIIT